MNSSRLSKQAAPLNLGNEGRKTLSVATGFHVFSTIQAKTMAKPFLSRLLRGCTIALITTIIAAQAPGQHMWPSLGQRPYYSK